MYLSKEVEQAYIKDINKGLKFLTEIKISDEDMMNSLEQSSKARVTSQGHGFAASVNDKKAESYYSLP